MSERSSLFSRFLTEIRRRHVGRVAIAYAAVAFVILQGAEIVLPAFSAPDWVLQLVVLVSLLGFPVALALAWIYDVTPHGLRRTESAGEEGMPDTALLPRVALLVVTVSVATGTGWWFVRSIRDQGPATASTTAPSSQGNAVVATYVPGSPITSLAVLPLDDYSEDAGQGYFVAGMHEALVAELSQLDGVRVVSRTTVVQYDRTARTMPQIASDLRVEGVVEGSVLRDGDNVRITVQLVHGPSDTHVWAHSYEEELSDIIQLQRVVASDIAEQLRDELNLDASPVPAMTVAAEPDALDAYLRGRFEQGQGTPEALERAATHFEQATVLDPGFAEAFAALSSTIMLLSDTEEDVDVEQAQVAAARALELDADLPEAMAVMSAVPPQAVDAASPPPGGGGPGMEPEKVEATRRMVEARMKDTELSPERMETWVWAMAGRQGETAILPILKKAMELGNVPPQRQVHVAQALVGAGRTGEAIGVLQQLVREIPESAPAWSALERAFSATGDFSAAVGVRQARMSTLEHRPASDAASLGLAFQSGGPTGYWEWCRADMEARVAAGEPVGPADLATVYAALDMPDEAFAWLERAAETRDPGLVALRVDPVWDRYRDQPRFRELARTWRGHPPAPPVP